MAKLDLNKLREEARAKFPNDPDQQRAYIAVMTPEAKPSTPTKRASTAKKKTPVKKVVKAVSRRRRPF